MSQNFNPEHIKIVNDSLEAYDFAIQYLTGSQIKAIQGLMANGVRSAHLVDKIGEKEYNNLVTFCSDRRYK
jgi:hypothetical protein|tara:strand:- start:1113 stop:1325 length:213 start_codon:yes stop_codon:yes gene_type:complete